jgi:hypothetical protein
MIKNTLEDKIYEAKELVEKVKELLKQREGREFELKFLGYDIDEDEYEEDEDNNEDFIVNVFEEEEKAAIFYETGWTRSDIILIKKAYLDKYDNLMFDLLRLPYYPWPAEYGTLEPDIYDWHAFEIVRRFSDCYEPDDFIFVLSNIVDWMQTHPQR